MRVESLLPENSAKPQFVLTLPKPLPPGLTIELATSMARNRSVELFEAASTSTILAFGAVACAHSTSSPVSCAHPQFKAA